MEESEKTLNMFWDNHYIRLNKCLDLRRFEQNFKNVNTKIKTFNKRLIASIDLKMLNLN